MIVESDLLQALVQKAVMEENLIRARNGAATARAGLNRAIGIPQDSTIVLDSNLPEPPPVPTSLEQAMARGRERRHDVRAVASQTDAASAAAAAARGERWPEIALKGAYTIADDTFLGDHGRSYSLMAVARWDAWTWGRTSARVARGRSEERAASERERAYRQQADFEILQAWQSLDESRARHEVALRGVASAERAATILEDRFQQGVARVTDLLDAETSEHEARVREAQARVDVQRSLRRLLFATGDDPVSVTAR
jgi:outer membrane protein TolC